MAVAAPSPPLPAAPSARLESVDVLRGLVMVLMALDHTRDFFHFGAIHGVDPLDIQRTSVWLFFTRWITHYCAPTFVFLAGTGAFLSFTRGKTTRELSWFLFTRGLWLVVLEVTYIQWFGWAFHIDLHHHWANVIWAIGWSMMVLAALVHLPLRAIALFGLTMIVAHNAFDGIKASDLGAWAPVWRILHEGGEVPLGAGHVLEVGYPLVPWIGVMAAGYAFGALLQKIPDERRRLLLRLGAALCVGFILLRFTNLYGDRRAWTTQSEPLRTVFSFLHVTKYPPSLCYLLMTLGPALVMLGLLDRGTPAWARPLLIFGRVPMFFYLLHLPLIHGLAVLAFTLHHGSAAWLYGAAPPAPPASAGFGLATTYAAWLVAVLLLYLACHWFAAVKRRRRDAWLSYL